jgi:hypothetical protein
MESWKRALNRHDAAQSKMAAVAHALLGSAASRAAVVEECLSIIKDILGEPGAYRVIENRLRAQGAPQ